MQLRTLNVDKMINKYKMREVTTHFIDGSGSLFDPDIFGDRTDKNLKFGYISLGGYYMDPSFFNVIGRIFRPLQNAAKGIKKYKIVKGELVEDPDGETGIDWLYKHYDELEFGKIKADLESGANRMQARLMKRSLLKLRKEDIFINKIVVLPLIYRDIDTTKGTGNIQLDELNQYYMDLIKAVATKSRFAHNEMMDKTSLSWKVQELIVKIFDYIADTVFRKTGVQRQLALTRSVDNSARTVIVSPEIRLNDTIGKTKYRLNHATLPLHHIINMYPTHTVSAIKRLLNQLYSLNVIKSDPDEFEFFYNDEYIKELLEVYHNSPALRLSPVKNPDGTDVIMYFEFVTEEYKDGEIIKNTAVETRPLSLLELLYMAVDTFITKTKSIITRYPTTNKASVIAATPHPSTLSTAKGTLYVYSKKGDNPDENLINILEDFPNVGEVVAKYEQKDLPSKFEEATRFSNLYLAGIQGDYDGDTTNDRSLYSKEAIEELEDYTTSPMAHLDIDGSNIRRVNNECVQGLWNLTTDKHSLKVPKVKIDVNTMFSSVKDREFKLVEIIKLVDKYHPETPVVYKGINTTFGRVIFNVVVFSHIWEHHTFINEAMTSKKIHDTLDKYASLLLEPENYPWYTMEIHLNTLDKVHDLGFGICDVIGSSLEYDMLLGDDKEFEKKKKELFKDIKDILATNDNIAYKNAEDKMISFMKDHYKDNQMADLYDSGAKPKWDNDLRTLKVGVGIIPIPGTGEYSIIEKSLQEGLDNKHIKDNTNQQIFGAYNRAVETADGGYLTKKMYNAFQSVILYLGDCKSTKYLDINTSDRKMLLFRYVLDNNGKVIMVSNANVDKFLNKTVKMRSPLFCKNKNGYCGTCLGDLMPRLYRMREKGLSEANIGLFIADIGSEVLNKFMKKTHDMSQKLFEIDDLDNFLQD